MNPIGKVLVLQHNDDFLFESGAICRYVASVENSPLYPEVKLDRARVDQWMDFFTIHLGRWFSSLFFEKVMKAKAGMGGPDQGALEEAQKFIDQQCQKVDAWLGSNEYFCGKNLSIADMFAYAYVEQAKPCDISLDEYKNLKKWSDNMGNRASISAAMKRLN